MPAVAGHAGVYDLLVALHVACAVIGFGAVALSGVYGASARHPTRPDAVEETRRYFRSKGWVEYLILVVPFLGGAALGLRSGRTDYTELWVVAGLLIWLVAAAALLLVVRPAERQLRAATAAGDFVKPGNRLLWSAALCDLLFVGALAVMVTQPK